MVKGEIIKLLEFMLPPCPGITGRDCTIACGRPHSWWPARTCQRCKAKKESQGAALLSPAARVGK